MPLVGHWPFGTYTGWLIGLHQQDMVKGWTVKPWDTTSQSHRGAISPRSWFLHNIPGEALITAWKWCFANVWHGTSCCKSRWKSWVSFCYYPCKPATINYPTGVIWFSCSFPTAVQLGWCTQPLLWCLVRFPPRWQTSSLWKPVKTRRNDVVLLFSTSFVLLNVQKGHAWGKDLLKNPWWAGGE